MQKNNKINKNNNIVKIAKKSKKCGDYSVLNLRTKSCNKCPKGFIKRVSYVRRNVKKSKNNETTKTMKRKYVHEACIRSRGLPGKTSLKYGRDGQPDGIGPLKRGELGRFGYHHLETLSKNERSESLKKAVNELGAPTLVRKLGAIRTYLKNTSPIISNIFYEDQKWVRKTYADKFKGDYKKSALFTKNN